uniref:Chitin-binding type-2 domain-containing protein n=1 Tax=Bracon brevicornis TaxID=1563983 RepID=A0A6V7KLF0_9HYME
MSSRIIFLLCLLPISILCAPELRYNVGDPIEVHEMHTNDLPPLNPLEPADNAFPKQPSAPWVPSCTYTGYFRDPFNCRKFYWCSGTSIVPEAFYCQPGWAFDAWKHVCDYAEIVEC